MKGTTVFCFKFPNVKLAVIQMTLSVLLDHCEATECIWT